MLARVRLRGTIGIRRSTMIFSIVGSKGRFARCYEDKPLGFKYLPDLEEPKEIKPLDIEPPNEDLRSLNKRLQQTRAQVIFLQKKLEKVMYDKASIKEKNVYFK